MPQNEILSLQVNEIQRVTEEALMIHDANALDPIFLMTEKYKKEEAAINDEFREKNFRNNIYSGFLGMASRHALPGSLGEIAKGISTTFFNDMLLQISTNEKNTKMKQLKNSVLRETADWIEINKKALVGSSNTESRLKLRGFLVGNFDYLNTKELMPSRDLVLNHIEIETQEILENHEGRTQINETRLKELKNFQRRTDVEILHMKHLFKEVDKDFKQACQFMKQHLNGEKETLKAPNNSEAFLIQHVKKMRGWQALEQQKLQNNEDADNLATTMRFAAAMGYLGDTPIFKKFASVGMLFVESTKYLNALTPIGTTTSTGMAAATGAMTGVLAPMSGCLAVAGPILGLGLVALSLPSIFSQEEDDETQNNALQILADQLNRVLQIMQTFGQMMYRIDQRLINIHKTIVNGVNTILRFIKVNNKDLKEYIAISNKEMDAAITNLHKDLTTYYEEINWLELSKLLYKINWDLDKPTDASASKLSKKEFERYLRDLECWIRVVSKNLTLTGKILSNRIEPESYNTNLIRAFSFCNSMDIHFINKYSGGLIDFMFEQAKALASKDVEIVKHANKSGAKSANKSLSNPALLLEISLTYIRLLSYSTQNEPKWWKGNIDFVTQDYIDVRNALTSIRASKELFNALFINYEQKKQSVLKSIRNAVNKGNEVLNIKNTHSVKISVFDNIQQKVKEFKGLIPLKKEADSSKENDPAKLSLDRIYKDMYPLGGAPNLNMVQIPPEFILAERLNINKLNIIWTRTEQTPQKHVEPMQGSGEYHIDNFNFNFTFDNKSILQIQYNSSWWVRAALNFEKYSIVYPNEKPYDAVKSWGSSGYWMPKHDDKDYGKRFISCKLVDNKQLEEVKTFALDAIQKKLMDTKKEVIIPLLEKSNLLFIKQLVELEAAYLSLKAYLGFIGILLTNSEEQTLWNKSKIELKLTKGLNNTADLQELFDLTSSCFDANSPYSKTKNTLMQNLNNPNRIHVDCLEYQLTNAIDNLQLVNKGKLCDPKIVKPLPQNSNASNLVIFSPALDPKKPEPKSKTKTEQLEEEAKKFGYQVKNISGDGNCFYHAVADQLHLQGFKLNPDASKDFELLRELAVEIINTHWSLYKEYMEEDERKDKKAFISRISQKGHWVQHWEINAIARALNISIAMIQSNGQYITIHKQPNASTIVFLGYEVNSHYQSLISIDKTLNQKLLEIVTKTEVDKCKYTSSIWAEKLVAQLKDQKRILNI